ncbi:MAG TPA: AsmA-like C-terminal region-containing protein [Opitutaceae bacterium]|nr:AsmA-like C-terminal region-containing protein [Opitutaceae bacterium]
MLAGIKRSCIAGVRQCASGLLGAAVWSTWLALVLLLAFQVYIASVRELEVPRFLLLAIENHLAESGVSVVFGRAIFDPSGRVLIEKARFKLASFSEPVVTARAIYIRLDPLALIERRFEASEIRATGADLFIPAMLSRSGSAERIVQDLDAGFSITSRGDEFSVDYMNCRLGGVCVSAHGAISAGTVARRGGPAASLPLAEFVSKNYVALSREFSRAEEQMSVLDRAVVTAVLVPSATRGAMVTAELRAPGLKMSRPVALDAEEIRASARFPLLGSEPTMASAAASAESLQLGGSAAVAGVRGQIRGMLTMDTLSFAPRQLEIAAASVAGEGALVLAPVARLAPGSGRAFTAEISAWMFNSPIWARADVDPASESAAIAFDASVSPDLLDPLSARTKVPIRRFVDFPRAVALAGVVHLAPGWKFADARARVDGRDLVAYGVRIDEARGIVTFDGTNFAAREAFVLSGANLARGSYEQDFKTLDFRYLLEGRLRPLDISPWFAGAWWPRLFAGFGFPSAPPNATVDVRGRYLHGRVFSVFGYADARDPVLLGVPFDRARTRLFVDQSGCEGLEFSAAQGSGSAQGAFKLVTEPLHGAWSGLDIDMTSTLDPAPAGKLLPPGGAEAVASFSFESPPSIFVRGHFDGPAAAGTRHKTLHAEVRSDAGMRAHGVEFGKASFKFDLRDDDVDIGEVDAGFAGGTASGTAQFTGTGADRRLRFKASLTGASLGQAAAAAAGYVSRIPGRSTALATFARERADVRLDLNASAEGRLGELETFVGDGTVQIQGAELGELSLLGGLSRLMRVTELRFTQARAEYKIENSSLVFSDVTVLGANSAIQAKGTYSIDKRMLDFSAKISPFQESRSILQVFNALSAPISAVFRVKLTGSIDKPAWSFVYSPLTLLRAGEVKAVPADKPAPPSPLANPPP